ncbi:MAG: class I tRNA ligase family protein, partial [bacterium]
SKKPKYYSLIEFPYPSGAGMHVGHIRSNTAMDIISRKRRMEGYNVLYPIGWDAFGLPTENYAIKTGIHPIKVTKDNTNTFRHQLKSIGFSFDWSREINTTDPKYYKWTQWIFLQFLKKGLAYKQKMMINWCPSCKIGLANEEVVNGRCERCDAPVEKREKEQWMLAITKYADRLDKDLDTVDYLPQIKLGQRNWIGRSEGAEIDFPLNIKNNYVLLHGYNGTPEGIFFPWLKKELEKVNFKYQAPILPNPSNPTEEEQVNFVLKNCKFDSNTILLGHSLGAVVAMKVLEKLDKKIAGLVLVGGFVEHNFKDRPRPFDKTFKWKFDFNKIKKQVGFVRILSDLADYAVPIEQGRILAKKLNGTLIEKTGEKPHFTNDKEPLILKNLVSNIKVFTTRPDTLFGATYMVLAPEHELVQKLKNEIKNWQEVEKYIKEVKSKTDIERTAEDKVKTGVELKGVKAINPATKEEIPIWIADYVLSTYGTGAIMAVPAHDERDFEFAKKYKLSIKQVIIPLFKDAIHPWIKDKKIVERKAIHAIVRKKNGDVLLLYWKGEEWKGRNPITFIIGGVENDENLIDAAKREIKEETGFSNLKFVEQLPISTQSRFFAAHKDANRIANVTCLIFDLINEDRVSVDEKETKLHDWKFVSIDKVIQDLNIEDDKLFYSYLNKPSTFIGEGVLINSGKFSDMDSKEAKKEITKFVGGKEKTTFKLRDWIFSRQRYWGEPIPVIHCANCGMVPVPEKDLPVELPKVKNYQPTDRGESPLANILKWVNVKCPKCKGPAKRETDTMPNWAGSSWYFLRYVDPKNDKEFASRKSLEYWTPVDWYNGGMEHTTLHLLYSRFWHKFLFDLKLVPTSEPYKKRTSHGMILGEGGVKMSKSLGNVINPDDIIKTYGADTLRLYEMFMGPFSQSVAWSEEAIIGPRRFLERIWNLQYKIQKNKKYVEFGIEKTIKKVSEDIEEMKFNTAISALMIFINEVGKLESVSQSAYEKFLKIFSPFAPHLAEELWQILGHQKSINLESWPICDLSKIQEAEIKIVVQINGKVRAEMMISLDDNEELVKKKAFKNETVLRQLTGKEAKKVFYVKNRLINIVV